MFLKVHFVSKASVVGIKWISTSMCIIAKKIFFRADDTAYAFLLPTFLFLSLIPALSRRLTKDVKGFQAGIPLSGPAVISRVFFFRPVF